MFGRAVINALPIILHYAIVMALVTTTVGFMGHVLFAHKDAKFSSMFRATQELMLTMLDGALAGCRPRVTHLFARRKRRQ